MSACLEAFAHSMSMGAMMPSSTLMFAEAKSASTLIAPQRQQNAAVIAQLRRVFKTRRPRTIVTLARGSSDNAATFARYLIERRLGIITGSLAPSVSSVYGAELAFDDCFLIAISQSGRSPDIVGTARRAKLRGATVIAIVNDTTSPLASEADFCLAVAAGPELSVAATKSFTLSLTAILDLLAALGQHDDLIRSLDELPRLLSSAWEQDWSPAIEPLKGASSVFVVARGHAFGIAQEVALKLKETCSIHAEAISAAEVRHGPMALVGMGFSVILLGQPDAALSDTSGLAIEFAKRGATVIHSGLAIEEGIALPEFEANAVIAPILQLQSFYRFCEELSRQRGFDPDRPPYLNKVTQTV